MLIAVLLASATQVATPAVRPPDVVAIALDPKRSEAALVGSDNLLRIVNLERVSCERLIACPPEASSLTYSPNGGRLVIACSEELVRPDGRWGGVKSHWYGLHVSSDRWWSVREETIRDTWEPITGFSPSGDRVFLLGSGDRISIVNAATGQVVRVLGSSGERIRCAAWVSESQIVTGGSKGTVEVWDLSSATVTASRRGRHGRVDCIEVAPDQTLMFVGGTPGFGPIGEIWCLPSLSRVSTISSASGLTQLGPDGFRSARWSPASDRLVLATGDWHSIQVHDRGGEEEWFFDYNGGDAAPLELEVDPTGRFIACSRFWGGHGRVFDIDTGKLHFEPPTWFALSDSVQWTADGAWVIAQNRHGVTVLGSPSFEPKSRMELADDGIRRVGLNEQSDRAFGSRP